MESSEFDAFYDQNAQRCEGLKDLLHHLISQKLHQLDYSEISSRIKSKESFLEKSMRLEEGSVVYGEPTDIYDLIGFRVVVPYNNNLSYALDRFKSIIDEYLLSEVSIEHKTAEDSNINQFGYRSWHIIVTINNGCHEDFVSYQGLSFEIQLRTVSMHAWALLSHEGLYKKERALSSLSERRLARASALLEEVDEIFDNIVTEIRSEEDAY